MPMISRASDARRGSLSKRAPLGAGLEAGTWDLSSPTFPMILWTLAPIRPLRDLQCDPLEVRKATLASIVAKAQPGIRFNEHIEGDGPTVLRPCLQAWRRRHRLEAEGFRLAFRPLARLAQDEERGGPLMWGTRLMVHTLGTRAWNEAGEVVTERRPNVDNRRRGWNSRPDRLLDTSACDSVLSRNLSLSKRLESCSQ